MIKQITVWVDEFGNHYNSEDEAKGILTRKDKLNQLETLINESPTWSISPRSYESAWKIYENWDKLQEIMK